MRRLFTLLLFTLILSFFIPFIAGNFKIQNYVANSSETFISYDYAIKSSKPTVILFYANWCTYCRRFMPKFNSVAKLYSDKFNFVKINIEASDKNAMLSKKYRIETLPTVYVVEPKYKVKRVISPYSYDSTSSFKSELNTYLKQRR